MPPPVPLRASTSPAVNFSPRCRRRTRRQKSGATLPVAGIIISRFRVVAIAAEDNFICTVAGLHSRVAPPIPGCVWRGKYQRISIRLAIIGFYNLPAGIGQGHRTEQQILQKIIRAGGRSLWPLWLGRFIGIPDHLTVQSEHKLPRRVTKPGTGHTHLLNAIYTPAPTAIQENRTGDLSRLFKFQI